MKTLRAPIIISMTTCFLLILAVTICKGNKFRNILSGDENNMEKSTANTGILRHTDDGMQILSTRKITKDINGYAGNVPLEIYMKDNRIMKVVALDNSETPSYFAKVRNSNLLQQWNNLSPEEVLNKEVDGISGATESSAAIIQSVQKAMEYIKEHPADEPGTSFNFDWIFFLGLLAGVALCTLIIIYFSRHPKGQTAQYVLNTFNLALVIVVTALSIQPKPNQLNNKEEPVMKQDNQLSVLENIHARTSIRSYLPKEVEEEKTEQLLRAAMAAPTATNRQPWAFIVIKDKAILEELATTLPYAKMAKEAPLAIAVCGDLTKAISGDGQEYWVQDASAATENLLLAAQGLGLGAVWTGVYPIKERVKEVQGILHLPEHIVPLNVIPIGYPAENPLPKDKWKPENVHVDRWEVKSGK